MSCCDKEEEKVVIALLPGACTINLFTAVIVAFAV
jgi:hypothetical protein